MVFKPGIIIMMYKRLPQVHFCSEWYKGIWHEIHLYGILGHGRSRLCDEEGDSVNATAGNVQVSGVFEPGVSDMYPSFFYSKSS